MTDDQAPSPGRRAGRRPGRRPRPTGRTADPASTGASISDASASAHAHDPERRPELDRRVDARGPPPDRPRQRRCRCRSGSGSASRKTIISLVLPIAAAPAVRGRPAGFHLDELPELILAANWWLLLAAFIVFYLGFPLRGLRWAILVRGTGYPLQVRDATEIIFISWTVNCLVPAKLGDIYRAYLLKINSPVSLSRTFGTVFIERVLDLFAIVVLGLAAGYWSFRSGLPPGIQIVFAIGVVLVIVMAIGLLTMRNFGRRDHHRAAVPAQGARAVRPVRGGRLRGARAEVAAAARAHHRAHLGDRGDAPVPRRRGDWASRTSTSGSAARSSSRSPPRC